MIEVQGIILGIGGIETADFLLVLISKNRPHQQALAVLENSTRASVATCDRPCISRSIFQLAAG